MMSEKKLNFLILIFLFLVPLFSMLLNDIYITTLFSKIVIKVGKPLLPPKSSSRDDLNYVTLQLQENINNLIG